MSFQLKSFLVLSIGVSVGSCGVILISTSGLASSGDNRSQDKASVSVLSAKKALIQDEQNPKT